MLAHRRRVDRSCPRVRVITAAAPARVRTGDLQFVKRGARPLEQGVQRARGDFSIIAERGRQYTVDLGRGRGGERRLEPEQRIPAWVGCLLYTSPSPRDRQKSRMPSSA